MSELNHCPQCGTVLASEAIEGLCPKCLMAIGLEGRPGQASPDGTSPKPGRFEPLSPDQLAPLFPQFEILEHLGHGGMGAVYRATQLRLDREVALKVIRPEVADEPTFAERFNREARTLARLNHPNIVGIHDFGEVDLPIGDAGETRRLYYFVMEYVDGANLRALIQDGTFDATEALAIIPQICDALQYAHDEGVVHRDIKPENILVDRSGRVKIADFGLAKLARQSPDDFTLTATHQVMGTPRYMAPEQMDSAHQVDHRADIYSLGVVFYEMLTGEIPAGHFDPPSQRVVVDVRLDEVVLRSLARDPERRYQHVSDVKTELDVISIDRHSGIQSNLEPAATSKPLVPEPAAVVTEFDATQSLESYRFKLGAPSFSLGLCGVLALASWFAYGWFNIFPDLSGRSASAHVVKRDLTLVGSTLIFSAATFIVIAAVRMRQLRGYGMVMGAAILALIPWHGTSVIGMFIGVWVINVLREPDTKLAFQRACEMRSRGESPFRKEVSGKALLAICWLPFAIGFPLAYAEFAQNHQLVWPVGWQWPLITTVGPVGAVAPICVTVLGILAFNEIRHSSGRLTGLGIAFFSAVFFPMLMLNAVLCLTLGLGLSLVIDGSWAGILIGVLIGIPVSLVVDALIGTVLWRRVSQPIVTPAALTPSDNAQSSFPGRARKPRSAVKSAAFAIVAFLLVAVSVLGILQFINNITGVPKFKSPGPSWKVGADGLLTIEGTALQNDLQITERQTPEFNLVLNTVWQRYQELVRQNMFATIDDRRRMEVTVNSFAVEVDELERQLWFDLDRILDTNQQKKCRDLLSIDDGFRTGLEGRFYEIWKIGDWFEIRSRYGNDSASDSSRTRELPIELRWHWEHLLNDEMQPN